MFRPTLILGLMATLFSLKAAAQQRVAPPRPDASSKVFDSTGRQYAYEEWLKLVYGGLYTLKIKSADDSTFLLRPMTMDEVIAKTKILPKPKESSSFITGEGIPSFSDRDLDGNKINIQSLKGKTIVLNFFFIGCRPCREEMPALNMLVDHYKDNKEVVFIAIALDSRPDLRRFLKSSPFKYAIIPDGRNIAQNNNVTLYPTSVVVSKDGVVLFHSSGGSSANFAWLAKAVSQSAGTSSPATN